MANSMHFPPSPGSAVRRAGTQNMNGIGSRSQPINKSNKGPIGILSRTVVPSTTVLWILPARIRSNAHNDLVFVGETSLQLHEFLPTRHLVELPARLDLGTRILAAKVLSHVDPTLFIDQVIKQEQQDDADTKHVYPSQLLVLALDSREIAFVYAQNIGPRTVKFRWARKQLPRDISSLGQYGRHLAIDSKSCALAISSAHVQFGLLQLKPVPELHTEVAAFDPRRPEKFSPFIEQRYIRTEGLVLKMDFLVSTEEPGKNVLALLISHNEVTCLHLYSWETHRELKYAKHEGCGPHRLSTRDRMPLLMIPSNHNASFILVTESGLSVYDDVLSRNIRNYHLESEHGFPTGFVASRRSPLWVQWAKPLRHSEYTKTNDDFFLIREDGELHYFEIKHSERTKLDTESVVGRLKINVDSAFTILAGPTGQGGDISVVAGEMNHGAVCHMKARKEIETFQTIMNLAPVRDMMMVPSADSSVSRDRLFVCSGKGVGHAAVAEIRRGHEAKIGFLAEGIIDSPPSPTAVWILPSTEHETILLVSNPAQTFGFRVDSMNSEVEITDDLLAQSGLQIDINTLAFGVLTDGVCVQITPTAVSILSPFSKQPPVRRTHSDYPTLLATINCQLGLFSLIVMSREGFKVSVGSVDVGDHHLDAIEYSNSYLLSEEPSSILLFSFNERCYLTIGTITGRIHLLAVDPGQNVRLLSSVTLRSQFRPASTVCSMVFLLGSPSPTPTIVCGLRDGFLTLLVIDTAQTNGSSNACSLRQGTERKMGQTSVELIADPDSLTTALILCNTEMHYMRYSTLEAGSNLRTSQIWLTDAFNSDLDQPKICAMAPLLLRDMENVHVRLVSVTDRDVLISSLSLEQGIVPRRLKTAGDPCHLAYSTDLGKLVVGVDQISLVADSAPGRPKRRLIRPGIQFLSLASQDLNVDQQQVLPLGRAGSRITSLLSWSPSNGVTNLHMIAVGLHTDGPDASRSDGCVTYLMASKRSIVSGGLSVELCRAFTFRGRPIYSLALFGHSSVVVCAGNELFLQTFDLTTQKWSQGTPYSLSSPAISIHVSNQSIAVTTARHSLKIFEVDKDSLSLRAEQTRSHEVIRNAICYAGTGNDGLLSMVSSRGGRLVGLVKQGHGDLVSAFDASLPATVTSLCEQKPHDSITSEGKQYIGSTQNGSIYEFLVLSHEEWLLASFVLRLNSKKRKTRFRPRNTAPLQRGEQKRIKETDMHVNGDKIEEIVRDGPGELRRLIEEEIPDDARGNEYLSSGQRRSELTALATNLRPVRLGEDVVNVATDLLMRMVYTTSIFDDCIG